MRRFTNAKGFKIFEVSADGRHETGMMVYAWYIFNTAYEGEPVIRWLNNDGDVVRRGQ